jgi:hypothetical protein
MGSEAFFGENIREVLKIFKEWRNDKMKHKCKCKQSDLLCNHEKVEYCKDCGKVHCLKCGKEWPDEKETIFSPIEVIPYQPYVPAPSPWVDPYYPQIYPTITRGTNGTINVPDPTITVSGESGGCNNSDNYTIADVPYTLT